MLIVEQQLLIGWLVYIIN